jgi:hypothetical protein
VTDWTGNGATFRTEIFNQSLSYRGSVAHHPHDTPIPPDTGNPACPATRRHPERQSHNVTDPGIRLLTHRHIYFAGTLAAIFYPIFYPKWQHSGIERLSLLVTVPS